MDDPHRIEAGLRAEQDLHRAQVRRRPPDVSHRIAQADATVRARQRDLADWEQRRGHWQNQQAATAGWLGLTRSRRHQHHQASNHVDTITPHLERARHHLDWPLTFVSVASLLVEAWQLRNNLTVLDAF